ncbi:cytosine deaminase [Lichenifustis flavocetrariae]|uniref:Cytosine deaminase n=1 Tax=Lichenifustis flavocetrariae TaxID=2949735 RepID=A0AA41Z272_9HYPH|nr:cytosine deaminase [Lichenifustis flavocetrariae]MCW6511636.1 cytosine deaminase [Lichenifustis flavocetrariae]
MTDALRVPPHLRRWSLKGARVPGCLLEKPVAAPNPEGLVDVDMIIANGTIESISPASTEPAAIPAFIQPGLVVPAFVDAHTHLDKGHIAPRAPTSGTFAGALEAVPRDREAHWSAPDVETRMRFAIEAAYAYGTRAIRTHLDCKDRQTRISWPVFAALREEWRDRVDLQASPLFPIDLALDAAHLRDVTEMVYEFGHCLGAATFPGPGLQAGLDTLFQLAGDKGWELDFHVDETDDPSVNTLAVIAQTALDHKFNGRILTGHCCTLSLLPEEERKRTIDLVARAGIGIVSLPMCNMYLQDRYPGRTPRWRGITALHELKAAGVPVTIASDNTRDPFYAYGDLDMAEVWRVGTRITQFDHPFGDWAAAVFSTPAEALGLDGAGLLRVGASADFVVFPARSLSEFMARPGMPRSVIRQGQTLTARVPDYSALDHLVGLRP